MAIDNLAQENAAYGSGDGITPPNPNDGLPEPDESMTYISDFVAGLTPEEYAFLKSEIEARDRGEMDPNMKTAEEVEFDLESLEDTKGATRNRSME